MHCHETRIKQYHAVIHRHVRTNQVVPFSKDGEGMVNQVPEKKDAVLTTNLSVPASKDGEEAVELTENMITNLEAVNSVEGIENVIANPLETLSEQQDKDPELKQWKDYLSSGKLPEDEKKAKELVLGRSQFEVKDGVLYHVEKDKTLRVFLPSNSRNSLVNLADFGGQPITNCNRMFFVIN